MSYTLPKETASTQLVAFKQIVFLITHYPRLRHFFLRFEKFETLADSETAVLAVWKRKSESGGQKWAFFVKLTAASIVKGEIATLMESIPPSEMGVVDEQGGVVEYLLRFLNCYNIYEVTCALGVRYLGAILEFPGFWQEPDSVTRRHIIQKPLQVIVRMAQDLGVNAKAEAIRNMVK